MRIGWMKMNSVQLYATSSSSKFYTYSTSYSFMVWSQQMQEEAGSKSPQEGVRWYYISEMELLS